MAQRCEPNITPLIDIVLVLLIVFMVMVPGLGRALMLRLPDHGPAAGRGLPPLRLELDAAGTLRLEGRPLDAALLDQAVDQALQGRHGPDRKALVAVHPAHPFKRAAELLDAVKGRHPEVEVALVPAGPRSTEGPGRGVPPGSPA